jgi:hypothetical protein
MTWLRPVECSVAGAGTTGPPPPVPVEVLVEDVVLLLEVLVPVDEELLVEDDEEPPTHRPSMHVVSDGQSHVHPPLFTPMSSMMVP